MLTREASSGRLGQPQDSLDNLSCGAHLEVKLTVEAMVEGTGGLIASEHHEEHTQPDARGTSGDPGYPSTNS